MSDQMSMRMSARTAGHPGAFHLAYRGTVSETRDETGRPEDDGVPVEIYSRRVRRPRMVPFLTAGALLGAVVGLVVAWVGPASEVATPAQEMILLGVTGALLGGLVGAVLFLVVEWAARR